MPDRLFNLLPAIYRTRDSETGDALRGLLSVAGKTLEDLEEDVRRLYDDLFIETCEDWVVPYLGDLLGVPVRYAAWVDATRLRRFIARAVAYRRRKGTVAVLQRIVQDLTGFEPVVREGITLVAWNQHVNHVRPDRTTTFNLRDRELLRDLGGPHDRALRTVCIRTNPSSVIHPNPFTLGLLTGSSAGGPLGAYRSLPHFRIDELRRAVAEYLPVGMQAGIDVL